MAPTAKQTALPFGPSSSVEHLDVSTLETWLWNAACKIRGATDAPKFKDFILPLIFYKRLSDVFDDEFESQIALFGSEDRAWRFVERDHDIALKEGRTPIVRFFIPRQYRWDAIRNHSTYRLGEFVTDAMVAIAGANPDLKGVLDVKDYNEKQSGQRALDDEPLSQLIEIISQHRLGLKNAEPDILGRAYEYLLRKFAEGQGQSAGEFYTPKEVGWLMADLLDPFPRSTVYDPACGSAGLLIKVRMMYEATYPDNKLEAPHLYGQELNPTTYAMAKMNLFLHDYTYESIAIGDTFRKPGFGGEGAGLEHFDRAIANPMWNQDNYSEEFYEHDKWNRFGLGIPPRNSADWGWVQHILTSLKESGRAAVVLDTGAVSRGSGSKQSNKERGIRKACVERDYIEGVILLPENLFYNTSAPGVILLLNRQKRLERKGQILLVNASAYFVKEKPKNRLTDEGIASVVEVYKRWETREKLSRVITLEEARASDYNLSPSQFVEVGDRASHRGLGEILAELQAARGERERADIELSNLLLALGLDGSKTV